jgi:5'-nucleotidase
VRRLRLLLCNDDGFDAPGLAALADALEPLGEIWIAAPEHEQSARSHALTLREPLRARVTGERRWAVSGTPADCVYVALHHLLPAPPDLVVSGINHGANLGNDVHYSGTVAAAREACLHGMQAISVSQRRTEGAPTHDWETARHVAARVVREVARSPLPALVHLNVNVPDVPLSRLRGLRAATLGQRRYTPRVDSRQDPRGVTYLWIGGPHLDFGDDTRSDGHAVMDGWAAVTPLDAQPNHVEALTVIRGWTDS